MGKQCLNKLSGNITVGCTINPVGVKNLYIMHAEDTTFSVNDLIVQGATFAVGATVILVEGYKQNIQVTASMLSMDASAKMNYSVSFKLQCSATGALSKIRSFLTGKFYVMAEYNGGSNMVMGCLTPLECSGVDWDSNANSGLATITLACPEGSAGDYFRFADATALSQIKAKVGV